MTAESWKPLEGADEEDHERGVMLADQAPALAKVPMSQVDTNRYIEGICVALFWVTFSRMDIRILRKCLVFGLCQILELLHVLISLVIFIFQIVIFEQV